MAKPLARCPPQDSILDTLRAGNTLTGSLLYPPHLAQGSIILSTFLNLI